MSPAAGGFHTITPHLVVRGVARAVEFYGRAFGAVELYRNPGPDGETVQHCEMLLGDSRFFLTDEVPGRDMRSPRSLGDTPVTLHLYVPDVDAVFARAREAGARVVLPLGDQFWGDRYGILEDPFGHRWSVATPLEDLSPGELRARSSAFLEGDADRAWGAPSTDHPGEEAP